MSGWVWKFSRLLLISFPASFVQKKFALKCIPGLALVGVLPLGQGGRPSDVRVDQEILPITTYIISSKFCYKNFALKCVPGLVLVGVLPLGQDGRPPDVRVGLEILQITTYIISSKFC